MCPHTTVSNGGRRSPTVPQPSASRLLAVYNRLTEEPFFGQVLKIPPAAGDLYTVRGGETRSLLCGSPAVFRQKNGTDCLYIGQTVLL